VVSALKKTSKVNTILKVVISSVFVRSKNKADIRDGNEYIIRKWLVLKFHGSGHLQILIHLNKITECLKMTTFKIVFTYNLNNTAPSIGTFAGRGLDRS
jgi:hypothetical protein